MHCLYRISHVWWLKLALMCWYMTFFLNYRPYAYTAHANARKPHAYRKKVEMIIKKGREREREKYEKGTFAGSADVTITRRVWLRFWQVFQLLPPSHMCLGLSFWTRRPVAHANATIMIYSLEEIHPNATFLPKVELKNLNLLLRITNIRGREPSYNSFLVP